MVAAIHNRSFILDIQCWKCLDYTHIILNKEDLNDWINGEGSIENILYYLSEGDRELMLSQTCGSCFDKMFSQLDTND